MVQSISRLLFTGLFHMVREIEKPSSRSRSSSLQCSRRKRVDSLKDWVPRTRLIVRSWQGKREDLSLTAKASCSQAPGSSS